MRKSQHFLTKMKTLSLPLVAIIFATILASPQSAVSSQKTESNNTSIGQTSPETSEARISELIEQLDNRDFDRREQAIEELQKFGAAAVKPLALKSLDCSPEASWRIKKTLESICTNSDEATLYQIVGILRIRYNNNSQPFKLEQRLQQLRAQWEQQRKKTAIETLRKSGLDVVAPRTDNPQLFAARAVAIRRAPLSVNISRTNPIKTKPKLRGPKLSQSEMRTKINDVLQSDVETNRKLAFKPNQPTSSGTAPDNLDGVLINEAIGWQSDFVTVRFPKSWKGTAKDLEPLDNIAGLDEVIFESQDVSADLLDAIANHSDQTLAKITFDDCKIDATKLGTASWPTSLNSIEFVNQKTTPGLLKSITEIESLKKLSFQKCDIDAQTLRTLKSMRSLRSLAFSGMEIDGSLFEAFSDLKRIVRIDMSVCKFQPEHYRELQRQSPVDINFSAQAFLGVRGLTSNDMLLEAPAIVRPVPAVIKEDLKKRGDEDIIRALERRVEPANLKVEIGADGVERIVREERAVARATGCRITDVIPGSGADKAGLRADDVIEKIDGEPILQFNDLRLHIAQYREGDKITLGIRRAGKPLKLEVKLTAPDPTLR